MARRRQRPSHHDLTSRFNAGELDDDTIERAQRFSQRSKNATQDRIERTALLRAAEAQDQPPDVEALPIGQVIQVYSLFSEVEHEGRVLLCVVRKTLAKLSETQLVVGDFVRFRTSGLVDEQGRPEAVVEAVLPRRTVLTRSGSFKVNEAHPIVANADQMLITASLVHPAVKWGLVDRMLIAAQSGGLQPIVCLNKIDLRDADADARSAMATAEAALAHYESMHIRTVQASALAGGHLDALRSLLKDRTTVLAGHSGVGKSSLIRALEPGLDIRIGHVSDTTAKGRHTTTSARRYALSFGGHVIDTPGVKVFGLWGITRDNLADFFPDLADPSAPEWRRASYERILQSLT